jgi:hypothetical protein
MTKNETTELEIQKLEEQLDEYRNKAWEIRDQINKLKLRDCNYEGKIVSKDRDIESGEPHNFLIVKSQQLAPDGYVYLSGLSFYINADKNDAEFAEIHFRGWNDWRFMLEDFLDLESAGKLVVLDKDYFLKLIKNYTSDMYSLVNDWVKKFLKPEKEND